MVRFQAETSSLISIDNPSCKGSTALQCRGAVDRAESIPQMYITVLPPQDARAKRCTAQLCNDDGTVTSLDRVDPVSASDRARVARLFNVKADLIFQACQSPGTNFPLQDPKKQEPIPIDFLLRRRTQKAGTGEKYPDSTIEVFFALMAKADVDDMLLEWNENAPFSCLDIDNTSKLTDDYISSLASRCKPRPFAYNRSHSGGFHFYFTSQEDAAIAAVWCLNFNCGWRAELKHSTRLPLSRRARDGLVGGSLKSQDPSDEKSPILNWLSVELADSVIEDWLVEKGFEIGRRYEHKHCQIDPQHESKGDNPVIVLPEGIYCHSCAARSVRGRSRSPGWAPWATLINDNLVNDIQRLISNRVHWEQARIVLASLLHLPDAIAERCYRVLLKTKHNCQDEDIENVFNSGIGLIRYNGRWGFLDGTTLNLNHGRNIIATLPQCTNKARIDRLCQSGDLREFGYNAIRPIRGIKVYGHHLDYQDSRPTIVQYHQSMRQPETEYLRPKYLKPKERLPSRMHESDKGVICYEDEIERYFPGINLQYLKALIIARGVVESNVGRLPMFLVSGTSGAGKTTTVNIAAAMLGDTNTEKHWDKEESRFFQGVLNAIDKGSFLCINEMMKDSARNRVLPEKALEVILQLTRDNTTHRLYVGPVTLGELPVFVFTDIKIPYSLLLNVQIGRRMHHFHFSTKVDWHNHLAKLAPGKDPTMFRSFSPEARLAADSLISDIIDDYFGVDRTFDEMMRILGVPRLEEISAGELTPKEQFVKFVKALIKAPNCSQNEERRFGGRGWKIIKRAECDAENVDPDSLAGLYAQFYDVTDFTQSERLSEQDWGALLGKPGEDITVQLRGYKNSTVAVRLHQFDGGRRSYKVNEEIGLTF